MQDGEFLFAFLDDVCTIASPARTRTIYNLCIRAKPGSGTERVRVLQTLRTLARRSGVQRCEDLGHTNRLNSSDLWEWRGCNKSSDCGKLSVGCQICNVHGRSCCSLQGPAATTLCAPSHPASPSSTRKATIEASWKPCAICWAASQGMSCRGSRHTGLPHCP